MAKQTQNLTLIPCGCDEPLPQADDNLRHELDWLVIIRASNPYHVLANYINQYAQSLILNQPELFGQLTPKLNPVQFVYDELFLERFEKVTKLKRQTLLYKITVWKDAYNSKGYWSEDIFKKFDYKDYNGRFRIGRFRIFVKIHPNNVYELKAIEKKDDQTYR